MKQDWTEKLKCKMDSYGEQPSGDVWKNICEKTGAHSTRHFPAWTWFMLSSAAALAAGVFLLHRNHDGSRAMMAEVPDTEESVFRSAGEETAVPQSVEAPEHFQPASAATRQKSTGHTAWNTPAQEIIDETAGRQETMTASGDSFRDIENPAEKTETAAPERKSKKANADEADAWAAYLAGDEGSGRTRRAKFSASLSVNGSGSSSSVDSRPTNAVLGANPLEAGISNVDWMSTHFKSGQIVYNMPEMTTEYSHRMPVHIGASVRYDIIDKLGLETGLTYSILSSDTKTGEQSSDGSWSKGVQTLHYLGIPLNLSYSFVNTRMVDIYVSAGGMMEKGVRGTVKTDEYISGKFHDTNEVSIKPKGVLWSVNAAAGVQLNILPQLGLFIEPGISHHFRRRSPVRSVYTDKPTDFALGFGLRYSFSR